MGERRGRRAVNGEDPIALAQRVLMPRVGHVTSSVLFFGVDGAPEVPDSREAWEAELPGIVRHRLGGLGLAAARHAGIEQDDPIMKTLTAAHRRVASWSSLVEALTLPAVTALDRMGIPYVCTKGVGIARLYPEQSWRPFRDIDLLVDPKHFNRAMEVFETLGFAEHLSIRQPRAYFDRFCREAVNLVREDGAAVDLHHHVPPWVWGERMDFNAMRQRAVPYISHGVEIPLAAPVHNLLVAVLHVISDRGRAGYELLMWRDLHVLAAACDADELATAATESRLDWIVSFVLGALPAYARPEALLSRLQGAPIPRVAGMRLRGLVPPAPLARHQIARALRYPAPNALAFLYGFGFPSREFLRRRFGSPTAYGAWWKVAMSGLVSAARAHGAPQRASQAGASSESLEPTC